MAVGSESNNNAFLQSMANIWLSSNPAVFKQSSGVWMIYSYAGECKCESELLFNVNSL